MTEGLQRHHSAALLFLCYIRWCKIPYTSLLRIVSYSFFESTCRHHCVLWPRCVLPSSHSTHTVADLQLLEQGACVEITPVYWKLMRHRITMCQYTEPLLFIMFCLFPATASILIKCVDWNHIQSNTKHHWFSLLGIITVVLIGMPDIVL